MKEKKRLDLLLTERGLFPSREQAKAAIMAGEVLVNEQKIDKAGAAVDSNCTHGVGLSWLKRSLVSPWIWQEKQ